MTFDEASEEENIMFQGLRLCLKSFVRMVEYQLFLSSSSAALRALLKQRDQNMPHYRVRGLYARQKNSLAIFVHASLRSNIPSLICLQLPIACEKLVFARHVLGMALQDASKPVKTGIGSAVKSETRKFSSMKDVSCSNDSFQLEALRLNPANRSR